MMKTAIYIQDGDVQLVLTPENTFEKNALSSIEKKKTETIIMHGSFYECQGGWVRSSLGREHTDDRSLIIRTKEPTP